MSVSVGNPFGGGWTQRRKGVLAGRSDVMHRLWADLLTFFRRKSGLACGVLLATATLPGCGDMGARDAKVTRNAEVSQAFDVSDRAILAGFSDEVFVGKVTNRVGSRPFAAMPAGQFQVNVIETLKGAPGSGRVVTQQGGDDAHSGDVILMEGDPLLKVGYTYLFAGRADSSSGTLVVVARYGDIPLDTATSAVSTLAGVSAHPAVKRMKQAVAERKHVPRIP